MSQILPKIEAVTIFLKDDVNQLGPRAMPVHLPFDVFMSILEPEIKKIAKKATTEVIRDQKDCG